jgi:hypothetical protein
MPEIELRKVMRCPVCFARENDVTLMKEGDEYYCIHCSYHGTAQEIAAMYQDLRKKYRWILKRVTLEELRQL